MTVFYKLPANLLQEGLSTDDGQDIIHTSEPGDTIAWEG